MRLAVVQMEPILGEVERNLVSIHRLLNLAVRDGADFVVFPECATTGYGFESRSQALWKAESIPGPSTEVVAKACRELGVTVVFGLLEREGEDLYNTAAIVGPDGSIDRYRKTHLPCVGADRFTDPGEGPLRLWTVNGAMVGIGICFDGGFPEFVRTLAVLGADLVVLPTNWAEKAMRTAQLIPPVRAFENSIYFAACNRIGTEAGYRYIGRSSIFDPLGSELALADHDREEILFAEIDPAKARAKTVVHCPSEYEIDRVNWRRPDLYGPLVAPIPEFRGHGKR